MCYSLPCLLTLSLEVPISTLAWSFPSSFVRLRPTLFSPLITLYRSSTHHCFKSFSCNTYQSSRKCCKQKTYVAAKPFRCNTYKKHGKGKEGTTVAFLKDYSKSARTPLERKGLPRAIAERLQEGSACPELSTFNCGLSTASPRLRALAIVRSGGNAHAVELIQVILLVDDVPLFAAFKNLFFLRSDALAHFQFDLLFFFQRSRQNLHDLLADGVPVFHKFHFFAFDKHVRDLVRQPYDFFAGQAHRFWKSSFDLELNGVKPLMQLRRRSKPRLQQVQRCLAKNQLTQNQLAVPRQLLLHLLVHLLIRDARPPHLVLVFDQDLAHFVVEPVLDRQLFEHPQADAVGHCSCRCRFNLSALDQPLHHLVGHMRYKVSYDQHLSAFPLHQCKSVSLLAAPIKCKEAREIQHKFSSVGRSTRPGVVGMLRFCQAGSLTICTKFRSPAQAHSPAR